MTDRQSPRFYFALPRLLAQMRGGDPRRAEQNSAEAWLAHVAIYLVTYIYLAGFTPAFIPWPGRVPIFVALAFLSWLFWLVVLYLNSLLLKIVRFRSLPLRRGQGVLIATLTTAMALLLLRRGSYAAEIGAVWLTATTMNLLAAAILALGHGKPGH